MHEARPRPRVATFVSGGPGYPPGLADLSDPPERIWVCGRLPAVKDAVAIVGARAATPYGLSVARALAADLARLGVAVVSGLARGIDAAAHRGALESGGVTVAVLPGGLDAVAPRHHSELAETIAARGALVTEWASGPPVARGVFVRRNRLIAALAAATVVVEAGEASGSLSTAAAARRLGRPVLAVPGDVDRPTSRGTHALLRGGARLCERAGDVLAVLPRSNSPSGRLLAALDDTPRGLEAIAARCGADVSEALATLIQLEWSGAVASHPGQRWTRRSSGGRVA